jgi:hypothetical protein
VADFHAQFVGASNSSASQYLSTEAANAEQSLLNAVKAFLDGHETTSESLVTQAGSGVDVPAVGFLGPASEDGV